MKTKINEEPIDFTSEEDLKVKVILPYLNSLGIDLSEISLEKSFSIILGKSEYKKKANRISGRLDILCKRGSNNLFIIEVKADKHKITSEDIDQGISYARLAHPIAPFVIITNGKETQIFDSIKKIELKGENIAAESVFWANGCELTAGYEINLRYEALKHFIGYSIENLKLFSRSQYEGRMLPLKGDNKKYIPELFLPREEINNYFREFMESNSTCFALIGESGVGKTNYICSLVEKFSEDYIVLFFNTGELIRSITDSIKEDFNWIFSPQLEPSEIIRRLKYLSNACKHKVCIFFDAIDEAHSKEFVLDLNDFVRKLNEFKNIKICVSCKINEWDKFLIHKGNPTSISEYMFSIINKYDVISDKHNSETNKRKGLIINRFNQNEIKVLDKMYQSYYKYQGELLGNIKDECKLGFMLRVVAEVYQNLSLPNVIDTIKLFEKYLDMKFCKIDKSEIAINYLIEIGKILLKNGAKSDLLFYHQIEESELREHLKLSVNDENLPELFSYNILNKIEAGYGQKFIGFYYSKIQDYVVAVLVLRLPFLSNEDFRKTIPALFKNPSAQSAISWYSLIANEGHKEIFLEYKQTRALIFLNEYIYIIEKCFPNLKDKFEPYTSDKIGIVISNMHHSYGFYSLNGNRQNLVVVDFAPEDSITSDMTGRHTSDFFKLGVQTVKYNRDNFITINPKEAAIEDIQKQLEKIVEKGQLNESNNIDLNIEKIFLILFYYGKQLNLPTPTQQIYNFLPRYNHLIPIDCKKIKNQILFFYAFLHCKDVYTQKLLDSNKIPVSNHGNIISYSVDNKLINYEEIHQQTINMLNENKPIPIVRISGDFPPFSVLLESLKIVSNKYEVIKEPILPEPNIPIDEINKKIIQSGRYLYNNSDAIISQYSDEQLKKYLESFYTLYISEYKILVETCFNFFKDKLPLYSSLPVHLYVEALTNKTNNWTLKYCIMKVKPENTVIEVVINPSLSKFNSIDDDIFEGCSAMGLENIFSNEHNFFSIDNRLNLNRVNGFCVIRNWVYGKIFEELKYILENIE